MERREARRERRASALRTVVRGSVVEESEKRWNDEIVRLKERARLEVSAKARCR